MAPMHDLDKDALEKARDAFWSVPREPSEAALERAIRAYLAAVPTPPAAWQDISTAPKNRARIIVAVPSGTPDDYYVGEAYFQPNDGHWWWANTSPVDDYADPIDEAGSAPTHWMPLPPAPSEER